MAFLGVKPCILYHIVGVTPLPIKYNFGHFQPLAVHLKSQGYPSIQYLILATKNFGLIAFNDGKYSREKVVGKVEFDPKQGHSKQKHHTFRAPQILMLHCSHTTYYQPSYPSPTSLTVKIYGRYFKFG